MFVYYQFWILLNRCRTEHVACCVLLPLSPSMSSDIWCIVPLLWCSTGLFCVRSEALWAPEDMFYSCLYEFCTCLHPCLYNDNECWAVKPSSVNQAECQVTGGAMLLI